MPQLYEAYPSLADIGGWLRKYKEVWKKISLLDFSPQTEFQCLVLASDEGHTLGEGLYFDEKARPGAFRDIGFLREFYTLTSIVTQNGHENLVLLRNDMSVSAVLGMADALNAWLNPEVLKTEGAWRFTQEWVAWKTTCSRSGREIGKNGSES